MKLFWSLLWSLVASTLLVAFGLAETPDRVASAIDSSQMVSLPGHVHRNAKPQYDLGRVDGSLQLSQVKLLTVPSSSQRKALTRLLAEQQDPKSPNFHKWLTPEQFGQTFGVAPQDLDVITGWRRRG